MSQRHPSYLCTLKHTVYELTTSRLRLVRWRAQHHAPFAALNADPEVMRWLVAPLTRAQSDALIERFEAHHKREGFGVWALELMSTGELLGCVGLSRVSFEAHFTHPQTHPTFELSWRLKRAAWGFGYATEAAQAVCAFASQQLELSELVAFTTPHNLRSRAVMERLGMSCFVRDEAGALVEERFAHPRLPAHHSLSEHVLYRLSLLRRGEDHN